MEENQNQKLFYNMKQSHLKALSLKLQTGLTKLFGFFSLKKTKRFWGIVYDSVSKQPLDPVIVKLLYVDGREVDTAVTDIAGRYGFLARPGKFKIFVRKTHYQFPSRYVVNSRDGVYENVYHGEFFTLAEDSEVVAPNIPMDPVNFDWNQEAKKALKQTYPYAKLFLKRLIAVVFWFGLIFSLALLARLNWLAPFYLYIIIFAYCFIVALSQIIPEPRLHGLVKLKDKIYVPQLWLELHNEQFPTVSFGKALVNDSGRFLLRASKGRYLLSFYQIVENEQKIPFGSLPVKIGAEGVFNNTLIIG